MKKLFLSLFLILILVTVVFALNKQEGDDMTLAGYLRLGGDTKGYASYFVDVGDIYQGEDSHLTTNQIMSWAPPYGANLIMNEYSAKINITSVGSTTTLNATTQYVCDSTDPFNSYNDGMVLTVISSTPSFADATGEIKDYINSTCIRVSFASAGSDSIVDASGGWKEMDDAGTACT